LNPFIVYTTNVPNDTVVDAPNVNLPNQFGEVARSFNATMYSMWVPNADRNCNGNDGYSCTIPVPLGSVTWSLTGEAINTLNPVYQQNPGYGTSNWWLSCFYPTANGQEQPVFLQSNQYPGWTSVDSGQNCK